MPGPITIQQKINAARMLWRIDAARLRRAQNLDARLESRVAYLRSLARYYELKLHALRGVH